MKTLNYSEYTNWSQDQNQSVIIPIITRPCPPQTMTNSVQHVLRQVTVSRAFSVIGPGLVAPAIQSLVADSTDNSIRGMAFRWLQLT
ncbi:hypothetical protein VNO77_10433 [Canavalia gladiata]|uniref:Uncharacterized protein n=1 Tax=Canavalia gladiata TaxID=3824 RepID=A0AAN9MAX6_CANGL